MDQNVAKDKRSGKTTKPVTSVVDHRQWGKGKENDLLQVLLICFASLYHIMSTNACLF